MPGRQRHLPPLPPDIRDIADPGGGGDGQPGEHAEQLDLLKRLGGGVARTVTASTPVLLGLLRDRDPDPDPAVPLAVTGWPVLNARPAMDPATVLGGRPAASGNSASPEKSPR